LTDSPHEQRDAHAQQNHHVHGAGKRERDGDVDAGGPQHQSALGAGGHLTEAVAASGGPITRPAQKPMTMMRPRRAAVTPADRSATASGGPVKASDGSSLAKFYGTPNY